MRFIRSQSSFKSGRLSPKLFGRIDTQQYKDAVSELKGFRVIPEGGAEAIKGSRFVNNAIYNSFIGFDDTKQISFAINGIALTAIIRKNNFNQIYLDILRYPYTYGSETSILIYSAGVINYEPNLFDFAIVDNYLVLVHFNGRFRPLFVEFNKFTAAYVRTLNISSTKTTIQAFGEYRSDTVSIGSMNTVNKTVELTSSDSDVVSILQNRDHFYAEALGSRKNTGDNRTYNFIASNFYRRVSNIANGIVATYLSEFTEDTVTEESLVFAGVTEFDVWATNLFYEDNYPKTVTTHEGRLIFGGCPDKPLSLAGSSTTEIFDFNRLDYAPSGSDVYGSAGADPVPTDPFLFTISSDEDSEITGLRSSGDFFIGTDRREYLASGGDGILSRTNIQIKPYTSQGVYPVSVKTMDNLIVYIDSSRKKLFQFKYNRNNGSFLSEELSTLFNDLLENDRIEDLEWAPHVKVLYILMESGKLYGITYDPGTETSAFFDTLETGITSMSYVTAREYDAGLGLSYDRGSHLLLTKENTGILAYEQLYYEKGISNSYIKEERIDANQYLFWENTFDIKRTAAFQYSVNGFGSVLPEDKYLDYSTQVGFPLTKPYRAMNLDTGEVVDITAENVVLLSGNFYIDDPAINGASQIVVGNIPNKEKIIATMPIEAGQQFGPAQLGIKNVDELGIRFYKSYSYSISSDGDEWQEVRVADSEGNAKTGRKETKFRGNPSKDFVVWIKTDKPEPLTITGINLRGVTNDG